MATSETHSTEQRLQEDLLCDHRLVPHDDGGEAGGGGRLHAAGRPRHQHLQHHEQELQQRTRVPPPTPSGKKSQVAKF